MGRNDALPLSLSIPAFRSHASVAGWLTALCLVFLGLGMLLSVPAAAQVSCTVTWHCTAGSSACYGLGGDHSQVASFKDAASCQAQMSAINDGFTRTCSCGGAGSTPAVSNPHVSHSGNPVQDALTDGVNLGITMKVANPYMSNFMQSAASAFIGTMFANSAEADRQQAILNEQLAQQRAMLAEQQRMARQQALDAMFARLNKELKLIGASPDLQMKLSATSNQQLAMKVGSGSAASTGLQLKLGSSSSDNGSGYGVPGLPGIYTNGARTDTASTSTANTSSQTNGGIAGLPGINLSSEQISQAPQLALAATALQGPERAQAEDLALAAAAQNSTLSSSITDPAVQDFQQANQQYRQAAAASAQAQQAYDEAQSHLSADKTTLGVAQQQFGAVTTPTPEQQAAYSKMLVAQQSDEATSMAARQGFDTAGGQLTLTRDNAAAALAKISPSLAVSNTAPPLSLKSSSDSDIKVVVAGLPVLAGTPLANSPVFAGKPGTVSQMPAPDMPAASITSAVTRTYTPVGNGLILGTGAIVWAERKPGQERQVMCDLLRKQSLVAHNDYSAAADCRKYDFVLGMALSLDLLKDLTLRVVMDDLTNGRSSAEAQSFYNKLRGKQFDELGCHSNGAMLCLFALENGDAKAKDVILYGPQVTRETLQMWDQLVRDGKVNSVRIYVNNDDPVAGAAISFADASNAAVTSAKAALRGDASPVVQSALELAAGDNEHHLIFNNSALVQTINEISPRIAVRTLPCAISASEVIDDPTRAAKCHEMVMYNTTVGCATAKPSIALVSGTSFGMGQDLKEPPLPCEALSGVH